MSQPYRGNAAAISLALRWAPRASFWRRHIIAWLRRVRDRRLYSDYRRAHHLVGGELFFPNPIRPLVGPNGSLVEWLTQPRTHSSGPG